MKDKEKQIKSDCEKCVHDNVCYDCLLTDKCWGKDNDCEYYQPKLPKDSVVLSREEYVRLQLCELKSCEPPVYIDIERIEQEIVDKYNQKLKSERDIMTHDLFIATKQSHEEGYKRGYDKGKYEERKETAEKIIDLIKTFCPDKKFVELITRIISERFGVETKE